MITKEKLIAAGAEKLSNILLGLYEKHQDLQKHLDALFAGLEEDPKKLISHIKKEITSLKKSSRFIDYYESSNFAHRLDLLRAQIANQLSEKSPHHAFQFMLEFLNMHEPTLNRVDDSNGEVGEVFKDACQNLGDLYKGCPTPKIDVVTLVFDHFMKNGYGIYDKIIHYFKDSLGSQGLEALKEKLQCSLNDRNPHQTIIGMKDIADCQKDVDAYIRACYVGGDPKAYEHLEIAKRLINEWRSKEALTWLDSMDLPEFHGWQNDRISLKIQALELCGEYEKAQDERLSWFEKTLNVETYGQILKNAKPEFKEKFPQNAIQKAFDYPNAHTGLNFLIQINEFESAAKFVYGSHDKIQGKLYAILRPAADTLKEASPLAATILYRKLLEAVLQEAKSKYYVYAAKDLVMCSKLDLKIDDWRGWNNHKIYLEDLLITHKRKLAFWAEYKSALQKQEVKEAKLLAKKNQLLPA